MGIALAVPCRIYDTVGGLREHRSGAPVVVQGDELELGIGDLDPVALALTQDPNLNRQRDRGLADGDRVGVAADRIADPDPAPGTSCWRRTPSRRCRWRSSSPSSAPPRPSPT